MSEPGHRRPLRRRTTRAVNRVNHAWDIETTAIRAGTPSPLYVSMAPRVGEAVGWTCRGLSAFHDILVAHFLIVERIGHRYVAHNGNRYDSYFVAQALRDDPAYWVEPWFARSGALRGMAVYAAGDPPPGRRRPVWYFADSMAMLAFDGSLEALVALYYPQGAKTHAIDWQHEEFDPDNPDHVAYALNDTLILSHALDNAAKIVKDITGLPLQNTIGKLGIMYWQRQMPEGVNVWQMPESGKEMLRDAKRGGLVYCTGSYRGLAWQQDINQSYTAQQRHPLPWGRCYRTWDRDPAVLGVYECSVWRGPFGVHLPLYCKNLDTDTLNQYDGSAPIRTVLVSPELDILVRAGWEVAIDRGYEWTDSFDMGVMVDALERQRMSCDGGPKGAIGTMIKSIGNNAYGKTQEEVDGIRYRISGMCPGEGWHAAEAETEGMESVWVSYETPQECDYHRLQIGVFITAYGRCQLYDQIIRHGSEVLYADTDCTITSRDIADTLDIDPGRYGAWKVERQSGGEVIVLNKKSYCWPAADVRHWKGIHVDMVSAEDYERAYVTGEVPEQAMTQRQGILKVLGGHDMFVGRSRHGSGVLPRLAS